MIKCGMMNKSNFFHEIKHFYPFVPIVWLSQRVPHCLMCFCTFLYTMQRKVLTQLVGLFKYRLKCKPWKLQTISIAMCKLKFVVGSSWWWQHKERWRRGIFFHGPEEIFDSRKLGWADWGICSTVMILIFARDKTSWWWRKMPTNKTKQNRRQRGKKIELQINTVFLCGGKRKNPAEMVYIHCHFKKG